MPRQSKAKQQEATVDELVSSIVKTEEEVKQETPDNSPAAKTQNCFTTEEAAHKRNIRQIYPEYYKLYERRSRIVRNLKKPDLKPDKRTAYDEALKKVEDELKQCPNKPKRSKFYQQ